MDNKSPHYSRERLLGEGGMGKVYLAQDNQLQRQVAIKELTYQSQGEEVNHALQEARLLARVSHTNIIQIYNVHDEGDHISLVMEYFKSKTLTQYQHETHSSLVQKLDLLQQLSAGLAAAHKNDVIHCDLKPTNILVNEQGQLKITDFGIALLASNEPSENKEPATNKEPAEIQYGSLLFMSPEQIKQQTLDYRSDIFSLGIVAYQLIVGSHPFGRGSATDIAQRICQHRPEHAKNLMLNAPSALTDLLMEMLIQPLAQRTLTASVIVNRLTHIRTALLQAEINEQATMPLSDPLANMPSNEFAQQTTDTQANHYVLPDNITSANNAAAHHPVDNSPEQPKKNTRLKTAKAMLVFSCLCLFTTYIFLFYSNKGIASLQVVILKPTLVDSDLMAPMQQDLVISAVEDALRQAVINTKNMYLISQREVSAITKSYPDNLKKLKQAVGASDIISTTLTCDNTRCKVGFSRLVANSHNNDTLSVKSEKNWLAPIDKFNAIFSTSQTQFASLFPEQAEINQSALLQRPIHEDDYRDYIALYSEIKGHGIYSKESLDRLENLLIRSPYLYAAYSLFRETASNLYMDSRNKAHLKRLELILQKSPPAYRYSVYHAIDSFWFASDKGDMTAARLQISEAQQRGADELTILEFEAYMFFNSGQYNKAVVAYQSALKLRQSTRLLYNLALAYCQMGYINEADKILTRILKIIPEHYAGQRLQANIWLWQGKLDLAIKAFDKIVMRINNGQDLTNLSLAYALKKQYAKSLDYAQKALQQSPEHPVNLSTLADIEMILGNKDSAIFYYQQVVTILAGKEDVKYLMYLAQAYGHLNEAGLAIATLKKAQILVPENSEVSYASAVVYSLLNERSSALHYIKKALKDNIGVIWFNLPWFDNLCTHSEFTALMAEYNNAGRCFLILNDATPTDSYSR